MSLLLVEGLQLVSDDPHDIPVHPTTLEARVTLECIHTCIVPQ